MGIIGHIVMDKVAPLAVGAAGVSLGVIADKASEAIDKKRKKFVEQHPDDVVLWLRGRSDNNQEYSESLCDKDGNELYSIGIKSKHFIRDVYFYEKQKCFFKIHVGHFNVITVYENKKAVGSVKRKGRDVFIQMRNDKYECNKESIRLNGREIGRYEKQMMYGKPFLLKNEADMKYVAIATLFPLAEKLYQSAYDDKHPDMGEDI